MIIDLIEKPRTFWWEDEDGNEISRDPFCKPAGKCIIQCSIQCSINENRYGQRRYDAWPVKLLKWIIRKFPRAWKPIDYSSEQTIGSVIQFDLVKKLIEERKLFFEDALIVSAEMCERCCNACLTDTIDSSKVYTGDHCDYCKVIDTEYDNWYRAQNCYITLKHGGDIAKAFKNGYPDYPEYNGLTPKKIWWRRLWNWIKY